MKKTKFDLFALKGAEKDAAIASIKKRRRLWHLLSLTIILAPFTMSCALVCSNTIAGMNGKKGSNLLTRLGHMLCSAFFAIILVPVLCHFNFTVGLIPTDEAGNIITGK